MSGVTVEVDVPSGGGGGGGTDIRQLYKHDENPTNHFFSPFRLWVNNDTIQFGETAGSGKNVDVFTPAMTQTGSVQVASITATGGITNVGREYILHGQVGLEERGNAFGGIDRVIYYFDWQNNFSKPHIFVNSMAEIVLAANGGLATPAGVRRVNNACMIFPSGSPEYYNNVKVLDAGNHLVPFDVELGLGGGGGDIDLVDTRVYLVVDASMRANRGSFTQQNYRLSDF